MLARAAVIVLALVAGHATADADARAEAILLFEQGSKEMKAGNFEKACGFFQKSDALYPDSGTKGSLARCYEKSGKLASSWVLWRELADTVSSAELRKDAAAQAERLEPTLGKYLIKAADTPGLAITINGKPSSVTGLPVPIDAGKVSVVATAPDHREWKTELTAADGATLAIDIPALARIEKPIEKPPVTITDTHKRKQRRMMAGLVGGAGVLALGAGAVFGLQASSKFDEANEICGGSVDSCATSRVAEAQAKVNSARGSATLSTVFVGVGGAAVIAGAVLWFTAPKAEQRLAISPTSNGFVVSGRF